MFPALGRLVSLCVEILPYCVNDYLPKERDELFLAKGVTTPHVTEAHLLCLFPAGVALWHQLFIGPVTAWHMRRN